MFCFNIQNFFLRTVIHLTIRLTTPVLISVGRIFRLGTSKCQKRSVPLRLKRFIFETLKAIAVIFSQQIAVKGLTGIILLLKNVLQATLLKNLALFPLQTVAIYAVIESVKFLYKAYDTFFGKLLEVRAHPF